MAYNEQNSRAIILRLRQLESRLQVLSHNIQFKINKGAISAEVTEVVEWWSKVRAVAQELEFLVDGILNSEIGLKNGDVPEGAIELVKERLERDKVSAERKTKSAQRIEKEAEQTYNLYKDFKGSPEEKKEEKKKEEVRKEEPKPKKETERKPRTPASPKRIPSKNDTHSATTPAEKFNNITKEADRAIKEFNERIPAIQRATYEELILELRRLDLNGDNIKTTVTNLKVIQSIKNKLTRLILNDEYLGDVKEFVASFNEVTKLQNEYWKSVESTFKPTPLLKEIRKQAISDTVKQLTESGIGANIGDAISDILRTNITTGGSYKDLNAQLLESLTDTQKSDGLLTKYSKQITNDSIQQYNRQYTQQVAAGLGLEWYAYQGSDIKTTRPFCDAMTDLRYFHVSEVPRLLSADDLYYMKEGKRTKVPIYPRTGLPAGLIEGTNAENFFIRAGGYNCGHAIRPVPERNVPLDIRDRVYNTPAYQRWKSNNG